MQLSKHFSTIGKSKDNVTVGGRKDNSVPDTLTRAFCSAVSALTLDELHRGLCHPGVARLLHFVRSKNLPFSTEDVKRVCSSCRICADQRKCNFHKR